MMQSAAASKGLCGLAGAVRLASPARAIPTPPRAIELFDPALAAQRGPSPVLRTNGRAFSPVILAAGSAAAGAAVSPRPETSVAPGSARLLAQIAATVRNARVRLWLQTAPTVDA
jgi:hypothetical protein